MLTRNAGLLPMVLMNQNHIRGPTTPVDAKLVVYIYVP